MPTVKLNISLDAETAETLRRRAAELQKPTSRYLADLIREDDRRRQDELAAEGYRLLSAETEEFATAAWPLAAETWPEWEDDESGTAAGRALPEGGEGACESHTEAR